MSSFAILCSGITLCPQASELGQSTQIISVASCFTCCLLILKVQEKLGFLDIIVLMLALVCHTLKLFYRSALSDWSCSRMMMNESGNGQHTGSNLNHSRADTECPHTKPYFITQGVWTTPFQHNSQWRCVQTLPHIRDHKHWEDAILNVKQKMVSGHYWNYWPSCHSLASLAVEMQPPHTFILHLYLPDWKDLALTPPSPREQERSSYQLKTQMYCAGLCRPARSTKCFWRDMESDLCCLILVTDAVLKHRKTWVQSTFQGLACFSGLRLSVRTW